MAPVIERTAKPSGTRISLEIPEEFSHFVYRIVMIPIEEENAEKCVFSGLGGKIQTGDLSSRRKSAHDFIGYSRKYQPAWHTTDEVMSELREGER